tara:strand:+ start:668 stop:928 length:261 start_codon:yes stop_codon:yes gene_type:complete
MYTLYLPSFDGVEWFYYTDDDNKPMQFATPQQAYVYSTHLTRKGMWGTRAQIHDAKGEIVPFDGPNTAGQPDEGVSKANFLRFWVA